MYKGFLRFRRGGGSVANKKFVRNFVGGVNFLFFLILYSVLY